MKDFDQIAWQKQVIREEYIQQDKQQADNKK